MKNAFINSSGVLTCYGYVEMNNTDTPVTVDDDFDMPIGVAQYNPTTATWSVPATQGGA